MVKAIWMGALDLPKNAMHGNSIFKLGGDFMSSLQFIGNIRRSGRTVSVREVLYCPILHKVAKCMIKMKLWLTSSSAILAFNGIKYVNEKKNNIIIPTIPPRQHMEEFKCGTCLPAAIYYKFEKFTTTSYYNIFY